MSEDTPEEVKKIPPKRKPGRPPGAKNKSTPVKKLEAYLNSGMDVDDILLLCTEWLEDEDNSFTESQLINIVKFLTDTRMKLLELGLKHIKEPEPKTRGKGKAKEEPTKPAKVHSIRM